MEYVGKYWNSTVDYIWTCFWCGVLWRWLCNLPECGEITITNIGHCIEAQIQYHAYKAEEWGVWQVPEIAQVVKSTLWINCIRGNCPLCLVKIYSYGWKRKVECRLCNFLHWVNPWQSVINNFGDQLPDTHPIVCWMACCMIRRYVGLLDLNSPSIFM